MVIPQNSNDVFAHVLQKITQEAVDQATKEARDRAEQLVRDAIKSWIMKATTFTRLTMRDKQIVIEFELSDNLLAASKGSDDAQSLVLKTLGLLK